jgi:predicted DNA-binding transcriptional regulator AlpA
VGPEECELIASDDRPEKVQASGPFAGRLHSLGGFGVSHVEENHHHTSKKPSAQVAFAKKAAALKAEAEKRVAPARLAASAAPLTEATGAAAVPRDRHESQHVNAGRAPPVYLLDKSDILSITHVTFPTIWTWMRAGTFPRSRVVGGKSMWLSSEIDAWLADLPVRALKGDAEVEVA